MWANSRFNANNSQISASNASKLQSNQMANKMSSSSVDPNQILMTANSLRTLFGDNMNQNLFQTIRDNASANRADMSSAQIPAQRVLERRPPAPVVGDYESQHFSRLDRNSSANPKQFDDSVQMRTETRFYDPTKMPQKSILKKSKDQPFLSETITFSSVEEEDRFLYGSSDSATASGGMASAGLPPGIVQLEEQRNERSAGASNPERVLSPISLRLKREMENMDRSMNQSAPKVESRWNPPNSNPSIRPAEEPVDRRNDWLDEEDNYQRRYRQHMNPSSDDPLEVERVRIQQLAAIEAGILSKSEKHLKRSSLLSPSPDFRDLSRSGYPSARRLSPELSPKRMRRRSPSLSPRRRSVSPLYRRPQSRSSSRDRYRRSRTRSRSRSNSRNRSRRRSRTPELRIRSRSPNYRSNSLSDRSVSNSMAPLISTRGQGYDNPYLSHQPLVGAPVGPLMSRYPSQMMAAYPPIVAQNIPAMSRSLMDRQLPRKVSALRNIPLTHTTPQSSAKKEIEKKEDKLINPKDLLIAERAKLREELAALKKQFEKKFEEQEIIVAKDGGTDSYAYRQLEKILKDLRSAIDVTHNKLTKNFQLINDVSKSKTNEKDFKEKIKTSGDISKVEPKKKAPVSNVPKRLSPNEVKKSPQKQKEERKESVNDEEEEEKNSRFHYFDSGPHWCRCCDKFIDNMKQYFSHIHTKEHLSKEKESDRTQWITKDYIKQMEDKRVRTKNQCVMASKGIQFIHPTQGFYCELCKQFLNDSYAAEKHFRTAKHNRIYTHYTLEHSDYERKWRAERDKSFTELRRKERELEKEKSKKEVEDKVIQRKRLEEEVKRKDREVKDKIEAMNKSMKTVKELEDSKNTNEKKEVTIDSSPKSIRLNLSSNKTEAIVESKKSDKNSEKSEKLAETETIEIEPKPEEVSENAPKSVETVDNTCEEIEDMLVIDEINCESQDERIENMDSEENIDENALLYPENSENTVNSEQKLDSIEENMTEDNETNVDKSVETVDTLKVVEQKDLIENKDNSDDNSENEKNSDEVEGVMPDMDVISDKSIEEGQQNETISEKQLVMTESTETNLESTESLDKSDGLDEKSSEEKVKIESKANDSVDDSKPEQTDESIVIEEQNLDNNVVNRDKCSEEVVEKDSVVLESNDKNEEKSDKPKDVEEVIEDKKIESTNENVVEIVDKNGAKSAADFDLDSDIAKLNERFETLVKQEVTAPEDDCEEPEDELEGFDVIDSFNEDNTEDVIELSD